MYFKFFTLLLFTAPLFAFQTTEHAGALDPAFKRVPLDKWASEGDQATIKWAVRLTTAELSSHQRLHARSEVEVDGNELVKRRGKGQLVTLVEYTDSAGAVYQAHGVMGLKDVKDETASVDVIYSQDAFVLPGDYRVLVIMFDTASGEHNVAHRTLHVAPLKGDPLPGLWENLPPVEFMQGSDAPDAWYLPFVKDRLILPVKSEHPVQVDLLVNVSASEVMEYEKTNKTSPLTVVLPALKVLSQMDVRNGSLNITALDLARHKVTFHQDSVKELDWPKMKAGLSEANPNTIDIHSLEKRQQGAQFFVSEVRKRLEESADGPTKALIILTGPMQFQSADLHSIEMGKSSKYRVFYIRYHVPAIRPAFNPFPPQPGFGRRTGPLNPQMHPPPQEPLDMLEKTMKPLDPHLFDIESSEQFRKALSVIAAEISKL